VLDVGKTNKKLLVYDEAMRPAHQEMTGLPADEGGPVHFERTAETAEWFLGRLAAAAKRFDIGAISVTTHGATYAALDERGGLAFPVIAYTTDPGADFSRRFYDRFGAARALHRELATPDLGALVNVAKGIAFAQETYPREFARARHLLLYPQYFAFLLTGRVSAETTYAGCHTYLYDLRARDWSRVADGLGVRSLLPPIGRPGDVRGTVTPEIAARTGLASDTKVLCGIHDSNASLLPLLLVNDDPFVLNSTGTWCVAMSPSAGGELTDAELDAGVFYNCSAFGEPVKTSLFMGGAEHQQWWEAIRARTGAAEIPPYDPARCAAILRAADRFILPGILPGAGPYPRSVSRLVGPDGTDLPRAAVAGAAPLPAWFRDPADAYALLSCSLAVQTAAQLAGAGVRDGMPIYIEGGFRKNDAYKALLASAYPGSPLYDTDLKEATAAGAAWLARAALTGCDPRALRGEVRIDSTPIRAAKLPADLVARYHAAFAERAR